MHGRGRKQMPPQHNPQLFDDTSAPYQPQMGGYGMPPPQQGGMAYNPANTGYDGQDPAAQFPGQQYLKDPVANMALNYGQDAMDRGKDMLQQKIDGYVSSSKLKYYFAVDTSYVGKKLGLLLFPFAHKDWSIKYNQDEPVAPRLDVNAPDLYIPVMAFVTYILAAGTALGTQNRFTPEQLGITSSTALVWMFIEVAVLLFSLYILNLTTDIKYLDLIAYCGYKYVGMILTLLAGMLFARIGYYVVLAWCSVSIAFFLVRSLKMAIVPHSDHEGFSRGGKRRMYMLLIIALAQPVFMWWLTSHLIAS